MTMPRDTLEPVKNRLINGLPMLEVLDDDSLQQRGRDLRVPNALRIHDDNRSVAAHAEARCLAPFHAPRAEEQILPLQKLGEKRIELTSARVGRAEIARAYEDMSRVRLHLRLLRVVHSAKDTRAEPSSTCPTVHSN